MELCCESVATLVRGLFLSRRKEIVGEALFSNDPEKPYGRTVLFQNDRLELLLTGWNPGYGCWPHTHGEQSEGIVCVFSGDGTFQTFPSSEDGKDNAKTKVLATGKTIVVPRSQIHSMRNDGAEQLVCLHAYWPPIGEMCIYNPAMTCAWWVSGGGAWNPEAEHIIEKRSV
ncbi:MAG: cysteine dioxygenase family protein [Patescibacteria group bacterium]